MFEDAFHKEPSPRQSLMKKDLAPRKLLKENEEEAAINKGRRGV